jgi:hypothetical protein
VVSAKLESGGPFFAYADLDGDIAGFTEKLQSAINIVNEAMPGTIPPDVKIDLPFLVDELGLSGLAAFGFSSTPVPQGYRNLTYYHFPKGRKGLASIIKNPPSPLHGLKLAPRGSDFVLEQEFYLKPILEFAQKVAKHSGGEKGEETVKQMTGQPVPGLSMTVADLIGKFDSRLIVVGRLDPSKPLFPKASKPAADAGAAPADPSASAFPAPGLAGVPNIPVPGIELLISIENAAWAFEAIEKNLAQGPVDRTEQGDTIRFVMKGPLPPVPAWQPVLVLEKKTGNIHLASHSNFLDQCLDPAAPKLGADPAFVQAAGDLPREGNAFGYLSKRFGDEVKKLGETAITQFAPKPELAKAFTPLIEAILPHLNGAHVSVSRVDPNGLYMQAHQPVSHKQIVYMQYMNAVAYGLASVGSGTAPFAKKKTAMDPFGAPGFDPSQPQGTSPVAPAPALSEDEAAAQLQKMLEEMQKAEEAAEEAASGKPKPGKKK